MKNPMVIIVLILSLALASCGAKKNLNEGQLYGATWQLDYISGPRIAFEGLFPDKKPQITFDQETQQVSGNAGCNGYSASYTLNGKAISFGEPGPATLMFCEGGGERQFLNMMQKVNAYSIDDEGRLNLLLDDIPMLRFVKIK